MINTGNLHKQVTILCLLVFLLLTGLANPVVNTKANELEGLGTISDPYLISTQAQLAMIHQHLNSHYKLVSDIEWDHSIPWNPIGRSVAFTGSFDGNHHTISGLSIDSTNDYTGLFGRVHGTYSNHTFIKNLSLTNVSIIGGRYTGALVGFARYVNMENIFISGAIQGNLYTGGVVGHHNSGSLSMIATDITLSSLRESVGGVVGYAQASSMDNIFSQGVIASGVCHTISNIGACNVGGIIGQLNSKLPLTNLVSSMYLINANQQSTNALLQDETIDPSKLVKPLVGGITEGTITNGYYQLTNSHPTFVGTAINDTQLFDQQAFVGLDFDQQWTLDPFIRLSTFKSSSIITDLILTPLQDPLVDLTQPFDQNRVTASLLLLNHVIYPLDHTQYTVYWDQLTDQSTLLKVEAFNIERFLDILIVQPIMVVLTLIDHPLATILATFNHTSLPSGSILVKDSWINLDYDHNQEVVFTHWIINDQIIQDQQPQIQLTQDTYVQLVLETIMIDPEAPDEQADNSNDQPEQQDHPDQSLDNQQPISSPQPIITPESNVPINQEHDLINIITPDNDQPATPETKVDPDLSKEDDQLKQKDKSSIDNNPIINIAEHIISINILDYVMDRETIEQNILVVDQSLQQLEITLVTNKRSLLQQVQIHPQTGVETIDLGFDLSLRIASNVTNISNFIETGFLLLQVEQLTVLIDQEQTSDAFNAALYQQFVLTHFIGEYYWLELNQPDFHPGIPLSLSIDKHIQDGVLLKTYTHQQPVVIEVTYFLDDIQLEPLYCGISPSLDLDDIEYHLVDTRLPYVIKVNQSKTLACKEVISDLIKDTPSFWWLLWVGLLSLIILHHATKKRA